MGFLLRKKPKMGLKCVLEPYIRILYNWVIKMNEDNFKTLVNSMRADYEEIKEAFLIDPSGNLLYKSEDFALTESESKDLLDSWKNTKGSLNFMETRFAILKWDDIQLAAKNIKGTDNICGSITPEGNYFVVRIDDAEGKILLIEWSIYINKKVWEK